MPFNDNTMRYNSEKHRYMLTEQYVLEELNVDLRAVLNTSDLADVANAPERMLERVSRQIYEYIFSVVPFRYRTERELALDNNLRAVLRDAMSEQLLYVLNNGDLSGVSGVNADSGMIADRRMIRAAEIAPLAKDILINTGIVRAVVPRCAYEIEPLYAEEGY